MNAIYIDFNTRADVLIKDNMARSKIIATAIALALSNLAAIPTSQVDSPAGHFLLQVSPQVRQIASAFGENMVIDARAVVEQTRQFWMLRYTAAHPISRPMYSLEYGFFDCVSGVGTHISPELHSFVNQFKIEILFLSTAAAEIAATLGSNHVDAN